MRSLFLMLGLCVTLAAAGNQRAHAETKSATQLATALAPVIDEQSILVAHLDLKSLNLPATFDTLAGLLKLTNQDSAALKTLQTGWGHAADELTRAGVRDICFVISIHELPALEPLLIVPLDGQVDTAAVEKALSVAPHYGETGISGRRLGELLVFARGTVHDRLAKSKPVARHELAAAFTALDGSAAQLLLLPSADSRRVVAELMPTLPALLGGGPSRTLTDGVIWAAAGIDLTPGKWGVKAVIQSKDAEAANALKANLPQILEAAFRIPDVAAVLPNFGSVISQIKPTVSGDQLILEQSSIAALTTLLSPPLEAARLQAARSRSTSNLKHIALAMFNYHDANKGFPPRVLTSPEGKPLLSWRVQLLPFLDAEGLYKEFHLDEPWDSEHNRQLIARMPAVFRNPSRDTGEGRTSYLAPILEQGIFHGSKTLDFREIVDGTSNTIMFVEADADHDTIWTKPDDLEIDLGDSLKGLVNPGWHGFLAAFADGSVRFFSETADKKTVAAHFTATGKEPIPR